MQPAIPLMSAYAIPRCSAPIDLCLDDNVGPACTPEQLEALRRCDAETLRRYPDASELERKLAELHGVDPSRVLVTAGADDALERACRVLLGPGRELILPVPTFEMLERYASWAGAEVVRVAYDDFSAYPIDGVLAGCGERTAAIAVVSPNNPTGAAVNVEDLSRLAATGATLLVDAAYGEFADDDVSAAALSLPNAIVFRTLSKAWGLAGARVGYAMGPARVIQWLRSAGHPYPVSGPSITVAAARLDAGEPRAFVQHVRGERERLVSALTAAGLKAWPSQANFVLARSSRAVWLREGLAGLGIGVRGWASGALRDCVRITCPGDEPSFARLLRGIDTVLRPEALLFDMDGVLADVRGSYRRAIIETARSFGAAFDDQDVARAKQQPDSNNDWRVTRRLLAERGRELSLNEVTTRFELIYRGLRGSESLLCSREWLSRLKLPLAVVTGRPRRDAQRFLEDEGITSLFETVVCLEDGPPKPDPAPVRLACQRLGITRAWMVGDTADDMVAARAAGVVPIGFGAPAPSLPRAARVLATLEELGTL